MPSQLETLTQKRDQLNARIQVIKNRQKDQQRKEDARRKIILGALLQEYLDDGTVEHDRVISDLDQRLRRERDRDLFALPTRTPDSDDSDHAPVRIDLHVTIEEKDEVKALGARWDPNQRTWWVRGDHPHLDQLRPWIPQDTGD